MGRLLAPRRSWCVVGLAALWLSACVEGERPRARGGSEVARLSLEISPNPTPAGEAATIRCLAWDASGERLELGTHVTVRAPDGAGLSFSAQRYVAQRVPASGSYAVGCELPAGGPKGEAQWYVVPGPAADVQIAVSPPVVRSGQVLQVTTSILDAFGNQTLAALEWEILEGGFELRGSEVEGLRIIGSGWATLRGVVTETGAFGEVQVGVDQRAPVVHIEQPERAAFVSGPDPVYVQGWVEDDVGVASFWLNGQSVSLDAEGRFGVKLLRPQLGLNILSSEALDWVDRDVEAAQAFLYGEFGGAGEWSPEALRLGLTPTFLDDDDPDLDDVAAVAERLLQAEELAPSRIDFGGCGGSADLSNFRYGPPRIDLWPQDGGIGAHVDIDDISLDYRGDVCVEACVPVLGCACPCTGFSGTARADRISTSVSTELVVADCQVVVDARPASANVNGLDLRLGGLAGLLNPVLDLFESSIREDLEDAIRDAIDDVLEETFSGLLDGLSLSEELDLPAPFEGALPLESCFTATDFNAERGHVDARVRFPVPTKGQLPPGAGALNTPGTPPSFAGSHALGLAFNDDLVSGLFFAAWRSGRLEGVVLDEYLQDSAFPLPVDSLTLDALLPPVLMPWHQRPESSGLALGLGDLLLTADGPLGEILVAVSLIVPLQVGAEESSIVLRPVVSADLVVLELEVLSSPDVSALEPLLSALEELLRGSLLPELLEDPIRIDLPRVDLGLRDESGEEQRLYLVDIEAQVDGESKDHLSVKAGIAAGP